MFAGVILVACFAGGASWMFQSSGYRGMAALLGATALMLPLAQVLRRFRASQWLVGFVIGMLFVLVSVAIDRLVPKGAYVAWGVAASFTVAMLVVDRRAAQANSFAGPMAFGGLLATLASTMLVANHWGLSLGLRHALPVVLTVLTVCLVAGVWRKPLWPEALRWQASTAGAMGLVAAVIGVMGGGAYMSERFSTGSQDFGGRLDHWQLGRDMLNTSADWWLGKGMGRFPHNYFLNGNPQQHPGDYRLGREGDNTFLTITGGLQVGATLFMVTQRVAPPGKHPVVTASVRSDNNVTLEFEVCEKHLLYSQGCVSKPISVKGSPGVWQDVQVTLVGNEASRGVWFAPRLLAFSVAMGTLGGKANLDNLVLSTADGHQLLTNGDFSDGMAHWFSSSDRDHLPWHIKSLLMNVLFDQGIVGLVLWLLMSLGAVWRLSFGHAQRHPLSPALAAGLVGFAVVGLFDSLLDVPRLAWLYYFLVLVALTLPSLRKQRGTP